MNSIKEEVTQADREAGWPFRPSCYKDRPETKELWMLGTYDRAGGVPNEAFARHRVQSTSDLRAKAEGLADILPSDAKALLKMMDVGWGWSSKTMSEKLQDDGVNITAKRVLELTRAFAALGMADRHQAFNEDDNYIRGSVYSLSQHGGKIQRALREWDQSQ